MKFLLVSAAVFALAVAGPTKRALVQPAPAGPAPVIDLDQLGPIAIGPAVIDNFEPIAIGPAIVDNFEPVAIGPAIVNPAPVSPSANAPLVQIILNIKSTSDVAGSPVAIETIPSPAPTPVQVVDEAVIPDPVIDVDKPIVPEPVIVVDKPIIPEPIAVVEEAAAPEGVIVAAPIIPSPAIVLPEILN